MIEDNTISEYRSHPESWRTSLLERVIHDRKSLDDSFILELFAYQYTHNAVYHQFCDLMKKSPDTISSVDEIPYLPISFFKTRDVRTGSWIPFTQFESSGTTSEQASIHAVRDEKLYLTNARACWKQHYKDIEYYCVLGLLPSYLERSNSSLVRMVDYFISVSNYKESSFYLNKLDELSQVLEKLHNENIPTVLIGVTYALLDLAEGYSQDLRNVIIMETGGMKGKREELPKSEVHARLKSAFNLDKIHSEYGMTECFSQAYSRGDGLFSQPRSMRISLSELNDPMQLISSESNGRGRIQICDLANIDSCAFIATDDLGQWEGDHFKVLGRIAQSDLRGCNLLVD